MLPNIRRSSVVDWPVEPVTRICRGCNKRFVISLDEIEFFRLLAARKPETAWQLPSRCRDCRHLARKARSAWGTTHSPTQ